MKCLMCRDKIREGYVVNGFYFREHFCSLDCVKDYYGQNDISDLDIHYEETFEEEIDDLEREVRRLGI